MEHRYSPRHPEDYPVTVTDRKGQRSEGRVVNASRDGMRARLQDAVFDPGEVVDVKLPPEKSADYGAETVAAYVVYVDEDQLGLWLLDE